MNENIKPLVPPNKSSPLPAHFSDVMKQSEHGAKIIKNKLVLENLIVSSTCG
jgi:hypothetical protein